MSLPMCPQCQTARDVRPHTEPRHFVCQRCKALFDDDPNEGGDYADHRPDIRIEREERREENRRQRRASNRFNRR